MHAYVHDTSNLMCEELAGCSGTSTNTAGKTHKQESYKVHNAFVMSTVITLPSY